MKWSDLSSGFCEGILTGPPEYTNSFTSLAMTFYGLMGLFMTRNHNILIRITSAMLAITGIGSFLYHWTWYQGWGQLDALPMLISSYLGAYQIMDLIIYKKIAIDHNNKPSYEHFSGILSLILMSMLLISLALTVSDDTSHWFTTLFAVPEILIAIGVMLSKYITIQHQSYHDPELAYAFKLSYIGIATAVSAAIIWSTTEILCQTYTWMRYLFAHGIWHITISSGMYFLMQYMIFIYSYHKGKDPYFIKGCTWYGKLFYTFVPTVELRAPDIERSIPGY